MADLFINYRREDAAWPAGRIGDRLRVEFGEDSVFFDTIAIEPGEDFVEAIGAKLETCRAVLAVLGPRWLEELREREGRSNDFVRIELSQAMQRGVRIIPLLIDEAGMPGASELPDDLKTLARRNAARVRADTFRSDITGLISFLQRYLSEAEGEFEAAGEEEAFGETDDRAGGLTDGLVIRPRRSESPEQRPAAPEAPSPVLTLLQLQHRTEFWKTSDSGQALRKIFVWMTGAPEDLDRIDRVVYRLHPTFKSPIREILNRANNFLLRTNGWGEFNIEAEAFFKDGAAPVSLSHYISFD